MSDLRERLLRRVLEVDRNLQLRATGATIHLVNNLRMSLQAIVNELGDPQAGDAADALREFPALAEDFGRFLKQVGGALKDGKITEEEIREIEGVWVETTSTFALFIAVMRKAAEGSKSVTDLPEKLYGVVKTVRRALVPPKPDEPADQMCRRVSDLLWSAAGRAEGLAVHGGGLVKSAAKLLADAARLVRGMADSDQWKPKADKAEALLMEARKGMEAG